jgi:hypothetical protein
MMVPLPSVSAVVISTLSCLSSSSSSLSASLGPNLKDRSTGVEDGEKDRKAEFSAKPSRKHFSVVGFSKEFENHFLNQEKNDRKILIV